VDANTVALLFVKQDAIYGYTTEQKVNLVAANQSAIDSDKATEIANGYWPTGIFVTPGGGLLVQYALLDPAPL
jgi:hypothetical protein